MAVRPLLSHLLKPKFISYVNGTYFRNNTLSMLVCSRRARPCLETILSVPFATASRQLRSYVSTAPTETSNDRIQPENPQQRHLKPRDRTFTRSSIRKELVYLDDPLQLASHTRQLLQRNDRKKALELVRIAGKTKLCTVSWNHIIDHDMSQGRVAKAIKDYNEVHFDPHLA